MSNNATNKPEFEDNSARDLFQQKVQEALHYCCEEADLEVFDAIAVLEIVKLNLFHKFDHVCEKCGQTQTCSHCSSIHPSGEAL